MPLLILLLYSKAVKRNAWKLRGSPINPAFIKLAAKSSSRQFVRVNRLDRITRCSGAWAHARASKHPTARLIRNSPPASKRELSAMANYPAPVANSESQEHTCVPWKAGSHKIMITARAGKTMIRRSFRPNPAHPEMF